MAIGIPQAIGGCLGSPRGWLGYPIGPSLSARWTPDCSNHVDAMHKPRSMAIMNILRLRGRFRDVSKYRTVRVLLFNSNGSVQCCQALTG